MCSPYNFGILEKSKFTCMTNCKFHTPYKHFKKLYMYMIAKINGSIPVNIHVYIMSMYNTSLCAYPLIWKTEDVCFCHGRAFFPSHIILPGILFALVFKCVFQYAV